MAKYLCVQCDKTFQTAGDEKARCPRCMRTTSLEPVKEASAPGKTSPRMALAVGAVTVVALAGAYAYWYQAAPANVDGPAPTRPLSQAERAGYARKAGADAANLEPFFEADDAVEDWADDVAKGGAPLERGKAALRALEARAERKAFVPWLVSAERDTPLLPPTAVLQKVAQDGGRARLYSLELALLVTVALREVGVDAMVAEILSFEAERAPVEPSGRYGYYGVAVLPGAVGEGSPTVFDPYGHRPPEKVGASRVLTDVAVQGAILTHRAAHAHHVLGRPADALEAAKVAVALDPDSPSARSVHASVLSYAGGALEAMKEFEAAAALRDDGPRKLFMAQIALAHRDAEGAEKHIQAALEAHPDYAQARGMLAQLHLARGDVGAAKAELAEAERLEPGLPMLPLLWADYFMAQGKVDEAAAFADRALQHARHNWEMRLKAAWILRAAGRHDDMRREVQFVLNAIPPAQRPSMEATIKQVLGPTALDAPEAGGSAEAAGALLPPEVASPGELKLGAEGSRLLGGGKSGQGPSLLGGSKGAAGGGLELNLGE